MGINTLVKDGLLNQIEAETTILTVDAKAGEIHYNPGLARDPKGDLYISIRSCDINFKEKYGFVHPLGYENHLHLGKLNEKTMKIEGLKLIKPDKNYDSLQWGIEDVRLFWRKDGLHGVGVHFPIEGEEKRIKLRLAEILIDYEKGTYKMLKDLGRPFGHAEKNWMPSDEENPYFDYVYSPTQIVKDGEVIGEENDLFIHNGTPLIKHDDGYISIAHVVTAVEGERTYAQCAVLFDKKGRMTHISQFFHFNMGWRENLKETIEFASGLVWSKGKEGEELLIGVGIKDELTAVSKLKISQLNWSPYQDTIWYAWSWATPPNRTEITA